MAANGDRPAALADGAHEALHGTFRHPALIYGSEREFVDCIEPFVREGVAEGDAVLVAVQAANVDALRESLNGDSEAIELRTVEDWYENATRTRMKFADWAVDRARQGRRIRLVGEPPWPLESSAGIRDWARHESVINLAFDGISGTFICPYDSRVLPDSILTHAQETHPDLLGRQRGPAEFVEPQEFCGRLDQEIPARWGTPVVEVSFDRGDLGDVRRAVEREATRLGVAHDRARDLVVAVNEIATNALVHGAEPASLRIWHEPAEVVYEVTDVGPGITNRLAGQLHPDPGTPGGWGVWMARMLSDALEVRSGTWGTTVTVHATLPREPA